MRRNCEQCVQYTVMKLVSECSLYDVLTSKSCQVYQINEYEEVNMIQ